MAGVGPDLRKRLRPLVPVLVEAMERHGHLQLAPEVRISLRAMSPATIDRALRDVGGRRDDQHAARRRLRWRSGVACRFARSTAGTTRRLASSRRIWFAQRAGGEGELRANLGADRHRHGMDGARERLLVREQRLADRGAKRIAQAAAIHPLGLDTDNDSVFMNETVRDIIASARGSSSRASLPSSQERPGLGRAEERVRGPADGSAIYVSRGWKPLAALARLYAGSAGRSVNFFNPRSSSRRRRAMGRR